MRFLSQIALLTLLVTTGPMGSLAAGSDPTAPAPEPTRHVLVFGGTGQLGAAIVERLIARGDRVSVFTRPGSDRQRLAGSPVGFIEGDLLNPPDIAAAFRAQPVDAVVVAVRVQDGDTRFYATFMRPLVAEAAATGVRRIVHNGAVGAGPNAANFANLGWERVPGLLDRLRDQGVGEDLIRAGSVPWVIIRNTRLYPDGTPATGRASLTADDRTITPMTRADLAALNVQCLTDDGCVGKTWHVRDDSLAWPPPRSP